MENIPPAQFLTLEEKDLNKIITEYQPLLKKFISDIFIELKDNKNICHVEKDFYVNKNYEITDENTIDGKMPIILLLGGNGYKIYSELFKNNYKVNICKNELIHTIDYDVSIMFNYMNSEIYKEITTKISNCAKILINKINASDDFEIISETDIKEDRFLANHRYAEYKKLLLSGSASGSEYLSYCFSVKYKNKMYQIVEFLFWKNNLIHSMSEQLLKNKKSILYQIDQYKFLLPELSILIQTNIDSMYSRINTKEYKKAVKDYHRLKYVYDLLEKCSENKELKGIFENVKKIFKKHENLFDSIIKIYSSIYCLNITEEHKEKIINLYDDFFKLNIKDQLKMFINNLIYDDNTQVTIQNIIKNLK